MIRIVPTGDLGLDVLTGGGWRLVKRFEERESACVVVRGGPGAGKSTLGIHVALELANALGGDVAVGCVEILPTEYVAQLQSTRPSLEAARVVQLPAPPAPLAEGTGPRVFIGLMTELDPARPDLAANLAALGAAVEAAGGKPTVFIVDSLIEGYGIGSTINRIDADATIKFAVQGGYALVLCEETVSDAPSPWVFAADSVLQLGVDSRERGRWIEVRKHRFGPSATGRHELDLVGQTHPEVFPAPRAWLSNEMGKILRAHNWPTPEQNESLALAWKDSFAITGSLILVTNSNADVSRLLVPTLKRKDSLAAGSLYVELDPLSRHLLQWRHEDGRTTIARMPIVIGASKMLRWTLELMKHELAETPATGRVVLGDVGLLATTADTSAWVEAIHALVSVLAASGWQTPVIAYDRRLEGPSPLRDEMLGMADASIRVGRIDKLAAVATVTTRWQLGSRDFELPIPA